MKITTFNPMILSPKADAVIATFEALGFVRKHTIEGINDDNITSVRMEDANGYHVDVAQVDSLTQDMQIIRMNVDDFDEAYAFLTARGFKNIREDHAVETKTNKSMLLIAPSGFGIDLCQHIKE